MANGTDKSRQREREQVRRSAQRVMKAAVDQDARDAAFDAIARARAHEEVCEQRWKTQGEAMVRVEGVLTSINAAMSEKIAKLPAGIIAALCAVVGFLANRVLPMH